MSSKVKEEELPKNWRVYQSKKSKKVYYYNVETKQTQWEHPSFGVRVKPHGANAKTKKSKRKRKTTSDGASSNKVQNQKTANSASKTNNKIKNRKTSQESVKKTIPVPKIKSEQLSIASGPFLPSTNSASCSNGMSKVRSLQPLPPLTKRRTSTPSEGSVSESSERIVAWLEDTSQINFKNHPVPDVNLNLNQAAKTKLNKTNQGNNKKAKKVVELDTSVNTHTASGASLLNRLLPNDAKVSCKPVGKLKYAPYKPGANTQKKQKQTVAARMADRQNNQVKHTNTTAPPRHVRNEIKQKAMVHTDKASYSKENITALSRTAFPGAQTTVVTTRQSKTNGQVSHKLPLKVGCRVEKIVGNNNVYNARLRSEDVLEMEAEEEIVNLPSPFSESDVVDMDIDNAEEYEKEIVRELKQMRNDLNVAPTTASKNGCDMNTTHVGYEGSVYIVLDTNVLLSHLKFVVELKDFPIQGVGRPTLVIPWVVVQELDNLKDNKWRTHKSNNTSRKEKRVDVLARIAIKFLNNSFHKSDPRVRGQTIDEAAQQVGNLREESNDDRILQCCLLFKERAESGNCVLFSNDNNLCNKALVNGVKAFNHQRLISGLRDLFQSGAIVKQEYFNEYREQLDVQDALAWKREKADEIICELQVILREGLSYIIETEMKEAYDELWEHVVSIKPPWTLVDVLQLLNKHWIAVFGHVLKRDKKSLVDGLQKKFDVRKGTPSSLVYASEILQLGSNLFEAFAAHSNYVDAIPKCLAAVNVLVEKCQEYQNETQGPVNTQQKCLPQRPRATIDEIHDGVENGTVPHEEVTDTFNLIWTAVTQFSSQIFMTLGYPNSLPCEAPQDLPKPTKEEAVQCLGVLGPRLINLVNSIKTILQDPWEKVSQNDSLFVQLEQVIAEFLQQVLSRDNSLSPQQLFNFCQDSSMRTVLLQGLSQLDQVSGMLQHCASCVVQQETQ